ncbi:MAG: glutamate-cysteine ligase family protein, partial [Devosiaceae bacterium]|nr:glutamate-cysteine ligase family protein [Devosiaceae bacterium]
WEGDKMGMKSYRLSVFDGMPRTGIPETMVSLGEYQRMLGILVDAGVIEDATKIWWDLRPSHRYPTLEMRICDVPTRLDDTIAIAALYMCMVRLLIRLRRDNLSWRRYERFLINENRWRAQRYGISNGLIDFGRGKVISYGVLLDELISLITPDAEALDCVKEVNFARDILVRGNSATRQTQVFNTALKEGASTSDALKKVVDMLIEETIAGI